MFAYDRDVPHVISADPPHREYPVRVLGDGKVLEVLDHEDGSASYSYYANLAFEMDGDVFDLGPVDLTQFQGRVPKTVSFGF
ncbi:hypothetical protein HOU02_gp085 [Caulobacter phage CcrBL9]|uniref:Uncharacterized protein n=1 Tax=Caulobacter phage CcrBL9 TaxID=2283270 RepID=A0A385EEH3_9CAUD|nr:hypothetical protein HOU02_gp085 [Caulobacter phage CcrBL9]AXQ69109.1 hypothetical protein CcrBL9_gp085 [Caulobacter phage CcrBL9]